MLLQVSRTIVLSCLINLLGVNVIVLVYHGSIEHEC